MTGETDLVVLEEIRLMDVRGGWIFFFFDQYSHAAWAKAGGGVEVRMGTGGVGQGGGEKKDVGKGRIPNEEHQ